MFRQRLIASLALAFSLTFSIASSAAHDNHGVHAPAVSAEQTTTPAPPQFDIKNPYEWVELGKNAGLAMAEIAGQLGVAGDKVLDSNSGKIAVALVGAKLLGVTASDLAEIPYRILALILGLVFFVVSVRIWAKSLRHDVDMQANVPAPVKSLEDQTFARFKRSIIGSAIIPIVLFGSGLVFYNGAGIFFGTLAALILAVFQFLLIDATDDRTVDETQDTPTA